MPPERAAYYARFATEYERIRAAEGRGSQSEAFYLALPDKDLNGHNSGQWRIRAASFRCLKQHVLKNSADRCAVLDLGAGNCWMSFRLGQIGYQTVAVDLLVNENDGLGAAKHYERYLTTPIRCFQAEATHLPFCSAQFDYVLFNASFHYAEDYEETLRESLRCLKVGGKIVIIDTPWYSREQSGKQMLAERQATFKRRFGTASDAVRSLEFLTDERLAHLAKRLDLAWEQHSPDYGWKWAIRPWIAKLRGRREPSRFRIYVATKRA
ncbi:class I SAM-dependent methyltransferase [Acidipila sp. EB88]|uniref:class I SAM-dependent methyltransferase n=1 Tax=Acidipila sp. EB88 TaxID=2305226 RepID=UPI001F169919|nr:class I SAM-dependent methyltransferase [Acidipila sp. EB88]